MRIVMMGTGPFAVPTFEALCDSPHEVLFLVTRPDPPGRRSRKKIVNPMRDSAQQRQVPVHEPESVNSNEFAETLRDSQADLFVVCDYGQILSSQCLGLARLGGINLHGSLLPKYRGAAPVHWAIYNGDKTTGITVIHMTPKLDGGPMLVQVPIDILPTETTVQLEPRMAELGVPAVLESIRLLESWDGESTIGEIQKKDQATKAPRLTRDDGAMNWSRSAIELFNQIRAFQPWPGTYTHWRKNDQEIRLIVHEAVVIHESSEHSPGTVDSTDGGVLTVACGEDKLEILTLQPAGKRAMPTADFLRGHSVEPGQVLS